ncbi:MAG: efflux RND transporter permease subunit [Acidobacteria bacterium]|nr:MAG: efflux RND transporter permease subunit [Acidobacteriota bacterium]
MPPVAAVPRTRTLGVPVSEPEEHEVDVHPLVRFAVERRVTMGMLTLGVLVLGALALKRLPLEFLPTISSSSISVQAGYDGSSPEEITRLIVQPLEDSLGTLNGVERMSSTASANDAYVNLEFADGTDMDMAAVEVRDRVDRVRHRLPPDLRQIRIRRFQSSDLPVLRLHLSATWDRDRLYRFAEDVLRRRLERLDGVAQVDVGGLRLREVQVQLDPERLDAHGVGVRDLVNRLRANNLTLPAGTVIEGSRKFLVRCVGELRTLNEIENLPLNDRGLRLADVARVTYDFPRQREFNYLNGTEALSVRLYKASNANLLEVVDRAKAELAAIEAEPQNAGLKTRIYQDASVDVRQGLSQLRDAGLLGGGLAVLAVFLFLRRLRTTLLVAIAIPTSVVATFVIMYLLRQAGWSQLTLNVVSLMGLVLALGMLVDSSIVVIEAIYRRAQTYDEDGVTAALRGASEVALPIVASTATTLCVFIPVIFLSRGGFFARYFTEIGTTVCIVMVASLIVALTVVPMAAALILSRHREPRPAPFLDLLSRLYGRAISWTLHYRLAFVILAAGMLYGSWLLFGTIERTFGSRSEARQITINVDTPRSYDLAETAALFDELYALIDRHREELGVADVTYRFDDGGGRRRWRGGKRLELYLKDESESPLTPGEVRDKLRQLMPVYAGVELKIGQSRRHWGGSGLEVELAGDDPAVLELLSRDVAARLAQIPGVEDVDLSLESGDDEIHVEVERQRALRVGLSSQAVALTVQNALSDRALSQLKTESGEVDLVVQYREDARATLDQLKNVTLHAGDDGRTRLPLDALADFEQVPGPRSIERENRLAKLTVTANASSPMASAMAMRGIGAMMGSIPFPPGYSWSFGRWNRLQQRDQEGSSFALLFAVLLVYMLMAALFESFTHPFSIMASVPFAFLGVGVVMKLAGQPRDNLTELGFVILVGVVVNNAIILVHHVNQLRRSGLPRDEAILLGGRHRLRPILMTAVTTILGLLPMVAPIFLPQYFGSVEGRAGNWAPVGLVILGGLTTSTFLTLVIIPTVYTLIDDLTTFCKRVAQST